MTSSGRNELPSATFDRYKPRLRDVLLETLRCSAALVHVCAKCIDSIDSDHPQHRTREFNDKLPTWFHGLNRDCDLLEAAQSAVGRDLRSLIVEPRVMEVVDSIRAVNADFDLTKPGTIREPIERHTTVTHRAVSDNIKPSQYPDSAGYHQKQEAIRDAVVHRPLYHSELKHQEDRKPDGNQTSVIQKSSLVEPVELNPTPNPQTGLSQSTHPFMRSPYYQDSMTEGSELRVSPTSEKNQKKFKIEPFRMENSQVSLLKDYPLSSSIYGVADSPSKASILRESGSSIKRVSDVEVRGNRYSIKGEGENTAHYYEPPKEGRIEKLDERDAVTYSQVTNKPSTYIRVIKEYKGESYILQGKIISADGRETPAIRETITQGQYRPSYSRVEGSIQKDARMAESHYLQHTSPIKGQQASPEAYRLGSGANFSDGRSSVTKELFRDDRSELVANKSDIKVTDTRHIDDRPMNEQHSYQNDSRSDDVRRFIDRDRLMRENAEREAQAEDYRLRYEKENEERETAEKERIEMERIRLEEERKREAREREIIETSERGRVLAEEDRKKIEKERESREKEARERDAREREAREREVRENMERERERERQRKLEEEQNKRKELEKKLEDERREREAARFRDIQKFEEEERQRKLLAEQQERNLRLEFQRKQDEYRKKELDHQKYLNSIREEQLRKEEAKKQENERLEKLNKQTTLVQTNKPDDDDDYLNDIDKNSLKKPKAEKPDNLTMKPSPNTLTENMKMNKDISYDDMSYNDSIDDIKSDDDYMSSERRLKMLLDDQDDDRKLKQAIIGNAAKMEDSDGRKEVDRREKLAKIEAEKRREELEKVEAEKQKKLQEVGKLQRPSVIKVQPVPVQHQKPFYQPAEKPSKFSHPRSVGNLTKPMRRFEQKIKPIATKNEIMSLMSKLSEEKISIEKLEDLSKVILSDIRRFAMNTAGTLVYGGNELKIASVDPKDNTCQKTTNKKNIEGSTF